MQGPRENESKKRLSGILRRFITPIINVNRREGFTTIELSSQESNIDGIYLKLVILTRKSSARRRTLRIYWSL